MNYTVTLTALFQRAGTVEVEGATEAEAEEIAGGIARRDRDAVAWDDDFEPYGYNDIEVVGAEESDWYELHSHRS